MFGLFKVIYHKNNSGTDNEFNTKKTVKLQVSDSGCLYCCSVARLLQWFTSVRKINQGIKSAYLNTITTD